MATQVAYNLDCMAYMRALPDKAFDLAVVDPPYGGGGQGFAGPERFGGRFDRYRASQTDRREVGSQIRKKIIAWDNAPGEVHEPGSATDTKTGGAT